MSDYQIKTGIARPGPKAMTGNSKYPLADMAVDSYLIVSKDERKDDDTDRTFRNRVCQSVRSYTQRTNRDAHLVPGHDPATYQPVEFTVLLLGDPPKEHPDAWVAGDIGIWRDK